MRKKTKQHVIQILGVLLAAVICAMFLAIYMIQHYGPSGQYLAGNTILSSDVMNKMHYKDKHPTTGDSIRFVFNGIEFTYFDKLNGRQRRLPVDSVAYETFYHWVSSTPSVKDPTNEVKELFDRGLVATLHILIQNDTSSSLAIKTFQLIQFAENDYFRVQLKESRNPEEWAYFYQPHIYQNIMRLFTKA